MNKWLIPLTISLSICIGGVQAAGDAAQGKTKSAPCMACHGADGNSPNPIWPKIAGQHPDYIKKQIMDFKRGARKDPLMSAQAVPLSDQDVDDLAAYFAMQSIQPGTAMADKVETGERLFRGGNLASGVAACSACHGPAGAGNLGAKFPAIAGQHADYTSKTLKDFRSGARSNDPSKMMRDIAAKMSDAEIEAVAQYVQGLQP